MLLFGIFLGSAIIMVNPTWNDFAKRPSYWRWLTMIRIPRKMELQQPTSTFQDQHSNWNGIDFHQDIPMRHKFTQL
jgi:hypothetical protein